MRPRSKAGMIASYSLLSFVIAYAYLNILIASGQRGGDTVLDNPLLAIGGLVVTVSSISALISGVIATFRYKDRSLLVFISTVIGLLVTLFLLGEVVSPH